MWILARRITALTSALVRSMSRWLNTVIVLRRGVLLLAIAIEFTGFPLQAESAHQLCELAVSTNRSIRLVTCRSTMSYLVDSETDPVRRATIQNSAVLDTANRYCMYDISIAENRQERWKSVSGNYYGISSIDPSVGMYRPFQCAYDGELYRTMATDKNAGQILHYRNELEMYHGMCLLLGDWATYDSPARPNLVDWLEDGSGWSLDNADSDSVTRLSRLLNGEEFAVPLRIHVELSPEHGYLPNRIQWYWQDTQTLGFDLQVTKFTLSEIYGTWLPVSGELRLYYREPVFPRGLTAREYEQMTDAEQAIVNPTVTWKAAPLAPVGYIEVDPDTIRINPELARSDFQVHFPADCKVYDENSDQVLLGGLTPINIGTNPVDVKPRAGLASWLLWGNAIIIAAGLLLAVLRRRIQRSVGPP